MRAHRLLAAAFVSLLVHAVVISAAWLPVPTTPSPPPPLVARLVERSAPPPPPRRDPGLERPLAREARRAAPVPQTWAVPRLPDAVALAMSVDPADSEPYTAPFDEPATGPAPSLPQAEAPPPAVSIDVAPQGFPRRARLSYTLLLGADPLAVGRSVLSWQLEDGSYRLISDSESTGVVELFRPQRLTYTSEGKVTAGGLRPETLVVSRSRRGRTDTALARLDWANGRLTYGRPADQRTVDLPPSSQDIVSFLFRLAMYPPPVGRIQLPITNGTRFENYELEVLAEERIETPMGIFNTLPLRQHRREGSEGIEVWLAVDYSYLPVRVRLIDRNGKPSGEQVVTEISIDPS